MNTCPKCGSQMILKNDKPECIFCFGKKSVEPKKPPKEFTEKDVKAMEAMFGEKEKQIAPKQSIKSVKQVISGNTAHDALYIMRNLPMPKDVRQFKKIQKIIKMMEDLVGENNGAA